MKHDLEKAFLCGVFMGFIFGLALGLLQCAYQLL